MSSTISEIIPGVSERAAELLEAVGVEGSATLSRSDPGSLLEEMVQANKHLELSDSVPSLDDLISWIEEARRIQGEEGTPVVTRLEEFIEMVPIEVQVAIPVSASSIRENKIPVSEVPEMVEFLGKEDLVEERVVRWEGEREIAVVVREISPKSSRPEVGAESGRSKIEPLKRNAGFDIRKTATPELNAGKKLYSRAFVRGVLHPQPERVKVGAFFAIIAFILFPATFIAGLLVLTVFKGQDLTNHLWLAAIPAALLVFGLCYLFISRPVKCRVCGQPVFSPKKCRRNPKAHRIPLLGYIFPTAIHLLIFHWFRCMYCGTSVRLKR